MKKKLAAIGVVAAIAAATSAQAMTPSGNSQGWERTKFCNTGAAINPNWLFKWMPCHLFD